MTLNFLHKWWGKILIVLIFLVLVFVVAFSLYVWEVKKRLDNSRSDNFDLSAVMAGQKYEIDTKTSYWIGAANPKVTIIEFADFACPYCKNSFSSIRALSLSYKDNVRFVFKDYPLHDESPLLAMAGRCAGEQGLFWPMHDKLFMNQGVTTANEINALANRIGADLNRFSSCLKNNKYLSAIQKDYTEGQNLSLRGTPTWFINGYKVEGEIPSDMLEALIKELVK